MTQHQSQYAAWRPPTAIDALAGGAFVPLLTSAPAAASTKSTSPTSSDSEQRLARRRKQCRVSQRRYRDKKGSAEYNLRLDVNGLRETVERLRQTRQLLESRLWSDRMSLVGPLRKAVEQYYVMFSQGLHDASAGGYERNCFDVQVGFLHAFLDPDVMFGESKGVANVVEQWRRYAVAHDSMWVKTVSAEILGPRESPIAVVQGLLGVRLSRLTIETVFPHILQNETLVQALIGKEVVYDTSTRYTFSERNQVLRQDLTVDFLSGFTKLLNSTAVTSQVLGEALIYSSSKIGDVVEERLVFTPVDEADGNGAFEPEPESPFELLDEDDSNNEEHVNGQEDARAEREGVAKGYGSPTNVVEVFKETDASAKRAVSRLDLEYIMC